MSALQFDNVSKHYPGGTLALSAVSFKVHSGEMLFVTGPSGAGKSTLLKLIHLSERPSRGAVFVDARNLAKVRGRQLARYRRGIGMVFQDHRLLMERSVADNVALPLMLRGQRRADIVHQVRSMLESLGLLERTDVQARHLSAGEQQRVGIARALISEPRLLIADEPIGNLDPILSAQVMSLFSRFVGRGSSVIVASHDLPIVKRMQRRVLVLNHGHLVDDIAPEDLAHG